MFTYPIISRQSSGPQGAIGGVQAMYFPPTGSAGAYTFSTNDVQIFPTGLTPSASSGFSINSEGSLYKASGSYENMLSRLVSGFPAKTTGTRSYEMWCSYDGTGAPTTNTGVQVFCNYADSNNYWMMQVYFNGTNWNIIMTSVIAGVSTNRSSSSTSGANTYPAQIHVWMHDHGDIIRGGASMYDEDSVTTSPYANTASYETAGRSLKTETGFGFGLLNNPGSNMLLRGCMIVDVED